MNAKTILRLGAAFCFLGHGAFGLITKAGWLPYFAVAGIPESVAWKMMPVIGAIDILAAFVVLIGPWRPALVYMIVWGTWTALLRPLAGEPVFETIERAGNYGVPLALFLLLYTRRQMLVPGVLKWTTVLLLAGHGALGVIEKPLLINHYTAIGLPASATALVGWFELALAAAVAIRPMAGLLVFVVGWKLATESLFLFAGAPVWEVIERAGSYAAPLALALLRRAGAVHPLMDGGVMPRRRDSVELAQ
ncbi:MAG TPA: hypothetical protein VKB93_21225 [Thermoanaerobaculia bacterium]|nr:hypothetical protein [Thermoanaerobaculia bacterium]